MVSQFLSDLNAIAGCAALVAIAAAIHAQSTATQSSTVAIPVKVDEDR